MKKYILIILVMFFSIYMFGCRRREATLEETQQPVTIEELEKINIETTPTPEPKAEVVQTPLLPPGPYKPTTLEIQTALKNVGYYTGAIDGKIGPLTRKAIEEFQKANGLVVDGKVGPKTWVVLSKYLNPPTPTTKKEIISLEK